jgi:peroxiredoxin
MSTPLLSVLAASAAAFLALAPASAHAAGEQAPDFTLRDINNKEFSLSDFKGKVVLVNFWATWCGPCKVEMPHLDKMDAELESRGFEVLSISTDDARAASMVKPFIKKNGYQFTVLLDKTTSVVSKYNPAKTLPYTAIVDRDGRIAHVHMGYNAGDEVKMRKEVEDLLGPVAVAPEGP